MTIRPSGVVCTLCLLLVAFTSGREILQGQVGPMIVKEGNADIPGARLFYIDTGGSGAPVILLHPATGSVRIWEHQLPALTAAGFRVIAYDRRGYGRTVTSGSGQAGTLADDLEALAVRLGLDRFHVVGSAAGGIAATDYALSFAKRLRSMVIANSLVGVQDEEYLELGRRLRPKGFAEMPPDFRELGPAYRAANRQGTERWLELERMSRAPDAPSQPQAPRNRITFAALETIAAPALLMTGDADLYQPPAAMQLIAARMPHAETLVLHAVGHSAYWEQPDAFNAAVVAFLKKH